MRISIVAPIFEPLGGPQPYGPTPCSWTSRAETFGLVAAEAQMAGCPVVAYRRGALPEVVEEGVGGILVEPGDEEALARAIPDARALDRSRVRASAERRLSIETTVDGYERELAAIARSVTRSQRLDVPSKVRPQRVAATH